MKPLSVEIACLLGIQNEIQAVCFATATAIAQCVCGFSIGIIDLFVFAG